MKPAKSIIVRPTKYTPEVANLLRGSDLPVADLHPDTRVRFFGAHEGAALVGVVGLELFPDAALLRSLAVAPDRRGHGIGAVLVRHAEAHAAALGMTKIYLLTTSAAAFFARCGYRQLPRTDAPAALAASTQFRTLCPASATFMARQLTPTALP